LKQFRPFQKQSQISNLLWETIPSALLVRLRTERFDINAASDEVVGHPLGKFPGIHKQIIKLAVIKDARMILGGSV
jgi:hypothetical protein